LRKEEVKMCAHRSVTAYGLIAVVLSLGAWGQSKKTLAADVSGVVELCMKCNPQQVRLPIAPDTAPKPQKTDIAVIDVGLGTLHTEDFRNAFGPPKWETDAQGWARAIIVPVKFPDAINQSGTYDVTLEVSSRQSGSTPDRLKFQLLRPAAKLKSLEKLLVNQVWYLPWQPAALVGGSVVLSEVSDRSGVQAFTITRARNSTSGTEQVSGEVVLKNDKQATTGFGISQGQSLPLGYSLEGEFPFGTTTGAVSISAPELSEPALMEFEVKSRLWSFYIVIFILAGIGTSFLLKVWVQGRIDLDEARLQGDSVLEWARRQISLNHDSNFQYAIKSPLHDLEEAIRNDGAADIKSAADNVKTNVTAELQKLTGRLETAKRQLDELSSVTSTRWNAPASMQQVLDDAETSLTAAQDELQNNDASAASTRMAEVHKRLAADLSSSAEEWRRDLLAYLKALSQASFGISAATKSDFAAALKAAEPQVGSVRSPGPQASAAELTKLLQDVYAARGCAVDLLCKLQHAVQKDFTDEDNLLAGRLKDAQSWEKLRQAADEFNGRLPGQVDDPGQAFQTLPAELRALDDVWQAALCAQVDENGRNQIKPFLEQQQYLQAAQKIRELGAHPLLGPAAAAPVATAQPSVWSLLFQPGPAIAPSIVQTLLGRFLIEEPLASVRVRTSRRLFKEKFLQSMVIAVLLSLVGYGLYADNFVGSFKDFSLVFFWAFGLDLTTDTLLRLARK
jgi:hypothetical protein